MFYCYLNSFLNYSLHTSSIPDYPHSGNEQKMNGGFVLLVIACSP